MLKNCNFSKIHFSDFCVFCFHFGLTLRFLALGCSAMIFCVFEFVLFTPQYKKLTVFDYFFLFLCEFGTVCDFLAVPF